MNHVPEIMILSGGLIAQVVNSMPLQDAGGLVSSLGPTALLGVGIVWAIRRGDKLVDEIHEIRNRNDAMMEKAIDALAHAADAVRENSEVIRHCKDKNGLPK